MQHGRGMGWARGRGRRCALHAEFTVAARNRAMGGCEHCCCAISINRVQGAYRVVGGCLEGAGCRVCQAGFSLFIAKVVFVYLSTCNGGCTNNSPPVELPWDKTGI